MWNLDSFINKMGYNKILEISTGKTVRYFHFVNSN